jgi:Cu+-exporting ATPase
MSTTPVGTHQTDPICGMNVEPGHAAGRSERHGKTYYFCSTACKERFDAKGQPEAHLCCRSAE